MKFRNFVLIALMSVTLFTSAAFSQNSIDGYLLYHNQINKPIPGGEVTLTSIATGAVVATTTTNNLGKYLFTNVADGTYKLDATSNLSAGGVTLGDSYLVLLHLLGFYPLSPIQKLAADVTGNGQVGWDDYTTIVIGWFINGYPFPAGEWSFSSAIVTTGFKDSQNLGGTSQADVNGSYIPNLLKQDEPSVTITDNLSVTSSNIQVELEKAVVASGFGLVFDLASTTNITEITSNLAGFEYKISNGQLRAVWISETGEQTTFNESTPLFTITGTDIELQPTVESHFIDGTGEIIPNIILKKSDSKVETELLAINSIYQQSNKMIVEVIAGAPQSIILSITDLNGKQVMLAHKTISMGINKVELNPSINATGIYPISIVSELNPEISLSAKVLLLK